MLELEYAVWQWLRDFTHDDDGEMAEKAVVMVAIIIASLLAWQLLGKNIADLVTNIAGALH